MFPFKKLKDKLSMIFLARPYFKARQKQETVIKRQISDFKYTTVGMLTAPWPVSVVASLPNDCPLYDHLSGFDNCQCSVPLHEFDTARLDGVNYGSEGTSLINDYVPYYRIEKIVCNGGSRRASFFLEYVADPQL